MSRPRIALISCAAVGGLLSVPLLPAAVALADDYDILADPNTPEAVTGLYGFNFGFDTTPPAVDNSVDGYQDFDYTDTTTGATGTFGADESTSADAFGDTNEELLVTSTSGPDAPPVGSVFDYYTFGDDTDENIYSDLVTPSGNVITDTLMTPSGDFTIPETFNAASVAAVDAGGVAIGDGDDIVPTGTAAITAINGFPPLTVVDQATQKFDVDSAGSGVGAFDADEAYSTDGFGTLTQTVLVTGDVSGTAGTVAGDVPAVGSVFNTISLGGDELVYSDLASPSGDVITDTLLTPSGDVDIPTTFDATAGIAHANAASIAVGNGYDIVADPGTEVLTGVNGLPPIDVAEEGDETFDVDGPAGTSSGSFGADVTTTADIFGNTTQTILVTSDGPGTVGTSAGDLPAVGSEIDTITFNDGVELIYSDLVSSTGVNVTSESLVTALGEVTIPSTFGAAEALATDIFSAG